MFAVKIRGALAAAAEAYKSSMDMGLLSRIALRDNINLVYKSSIDEGRAASSCAPSCCAMDGVKIEVMGATAAAAAAVKDVCGRLLGGGTT